MNHWTGTDAWQDLPPYPHLAFEAVNKTGKKKNQTIKTCAETTSNYTHTNSETHVFNNMAVSLCMHGLKNPIPHSHSTSHFEMDA